MFGSRPPHPNQKQPPHPNQERPLHPQGNPPGNPQGERNNQPPLLTEHDRQLLGELLDNDEQAQALFGTLQNAPPELAAIGFLLLRVFERTRST